MRIFRSVLLTPRLAIVFFLAQISSGITQNYDFSGALLSAKGPLSIEMGDPLVVMATVQNTASGFELRRRDWDFSPSWIASLENPSWLNTATNWDFYQYGVVFEGATATAAITLDAVNLPTTPGRYTILVNTFYPYLSEAFELTYLRMDQSPWVVTFSLLAPTRPTVALVSPAANARLTSSTAAISGTARDTRHGIQRVEFQLGDSDFQVADGTTNWSAQVQLAPGPNIVRVRSINSIGTESYLATRTFTYVVTSPLTLQINGNGTVSPNLAGQDLEVGKNYDLTAKPGAGYIFAGWNGTIATNTPALKFAMQSNMVIVANFIPNPFTPVKGAYNGLVYDTNWVHAESSGMFTINVTGSGAFSGTLQIGGVRSSLSGQFDAVGKSSRLSKRSNLDTLTVNLEFPDFSFGVGLLTGTVSNGTWTAFIGGPRAGFDGRTSISPQAGQYTVVFPGSSNSLFGPRGDGFSTLNVDKAGRGRLAGQLADGKKFSQSAMLSKEGIWPFYVPLSGGSEFGLSWMVFTNTPSDDMTGGVIWLKLPNASEKYYPAGFTNLTTISCSRYRQPSVGNNLLNLTNGNLVLEGGNLDQSFTNRVLIGPNNRVTNLESNKLTLAFAASTGLFKGTVIDPISGKTISFNGVALQKPNLARGFFLGTSESGSLLLEP